MDETEGYGKNVLDGTKVELFGLNENTVYYYYKDFINPTLGKIDLLEQLYISIYIYLDIYSIYI